MAEVKPLVKFVAGLAAEYASITPDANTLYFLTDTRQLYKGNVLFSGGSYATVTEFPATGEINTLYINTTTGEVKFYNGTDYVEVVKPIDTITADAKGLATAKAVYDYVAAEIAKVDASGISNTITQLQTKVTALETGLSTAQDDIKDLIADVASNTTEITNIKTSLDDKANASDVYTKTETDTAIASAVSAAGHITYQIVDTLPDVTEAANNVIYLVPKTDGAGNQLYDEYMKIEPDGQDATLEKIGDTSVSIEGLAKESDLQQLITNLGTAAYKAVEDFDEAGAADQALADAKTYTDNALTWNEL